MKRAYIAALAGLALLTGLPLAASGPASPKDNPLSALQARDARLNAIGWKLATGNARYCKDAPPSVGLLLQDMAGYGDPARMRTAAGISGSIAIQAAAPGSPAEQAGLRPNMEILALGGLDVRSLAAPAKGYERLEALTNRMEQALAADQAISLTWLATKSSAVSSATLAGIPACSGRFEIRTGSKGASADGTRVLIGDKFAGLDYAEDEYAALIAHEFAHNLLGHRTLLDAKRRSVSTRATERVADRMMPWLIANAGYDPQAAVRFMNRWGPRHGGGIFRQRTHDGWDERAEMIAVEAALVEQAMAAHGSADWTHFYALMPLPEA